MILCACSGGSGDFDPLAGGNISDTVATTISSSLPDSGSVTIQQAQTQQFFVTAAAPLGAPITYTWALNGVVVQTGSLSSYGITATVGNIGTHTLLITATDGATSDSKTWSVKVNGPPVLTKLSTDTPKVTADINPDTGLPYEIYIEASVNDPNNDNITYTWRLNGAASDYLISSGGSNTLARARLIGNQSIVGSLNISVEASDGSATATTTWTAEVNYFPMACNQLTPGTICTYGGNPNIGQGRNPLESSVGIRTQIIAEAADEVGNFFLADYANNAVWYWNKTNTDVVRLGITIPANQMKVVAGSGEATSGTNGKAIEKGLYNPRGLYYVPDGFGGNLYISEWSGSKVKWVDATGTMRQVTAIASCSNPAGLAYYSGYLYVACYGSHRVGRYDVLNEVWTANFLGNGTNSYTGDGGAPASATMANPYGVFADADGLYVSALSHHRIRFVRWSGLADKVFFGVTTVVQNTVRTIIGDGTATNNNNDQAPLSLKIGGPTGVQVDDDVIFMSMINGNRDYVSAANNTGSDVVIGAVTVAANRARHLTYYTGADVVGYNGSGIPMTSGRINNPYSIYLDATNSVLWISDYSNNRFRKIDLTASRLYDQVGSGDTRAGNNGSAELASNLHLFNNPSGLGWDANSRNLYVVDQNNQMIRKISPYGLMSTVYGSGSAGNPTQDNDVPSNVLTDLAYSGNASNAGLFCSADGSLLTVNPNGGRTVRAWNRSTATQAFGGVFISANRVSTIAGDYTNPLAGAITANVAPIYPATSSATTARFYFPTDITAYELRDSGTGAVTSRTFFVADQGNHCIREIDNDGNMHTAAGICVYRNTVTNPNSGGTNNNADPWTVELNRPHGVVNDSIGNLWVADTFNDKIRYYNRSAGAVTIAGIVVNAGKMATIVCRDGNNVTGDTGENVAADLARCYRPTDLAYFKSSTAEYLCYSQFWAHNVRCLNLTAGNAEYGRIRTVAGSGQATQQPGYTFGYEQEGIPGFAAAGTAARLYNPKDITFDHLGDLYISDHTNQMVRKLRFLSP
ncbi:MAG: hypothetical protein AB7N80_07400 [Bdellovibrionales bacterium]